MRLTAMQVLVKRLIREKEDLKQENMRLKKQILTDLHITNTQLDKQLNDAYISKVRLLIN